MPIGIAVSGGPDSLALLLLAQAALPRQTFAATVDHGLRPESAGEAAVVAAICRDLGVPHATLGVTVPPGNLQQAARMARYTALAKWARGNGLAQIATAHHAEDQAETVLMRLNRGGGLYGLSGIRRQRWLSAGESGDTVSLVRPVLGWRRSTLVGICRAAGLDPVDDPSNHAEAFDRVAMRRKIAAAGWLDIDAIARSAAHLADAAALFDEELRSTIWQQRVKPSADRVTYVPVSARFANIELVRSIFERLGASARRSDIATLIERLEAGEAANLAGILARVEPQPPDGPDNQQACVWSFAPEPPRRTG